MISTSVTGGKPFLKWAGGKGKLLPQLHALLPLGFNNYFEPFVGGGAVFFSLVHSGTSVISDINTDLMNVYQHIKDDINIVITELKKIELEYKQLSQEARQEYYYLRRAEYNATSSGLRKSILFLFLNKTCFNGLYRQNSKGEFNVPFGRYANPAICNEENLYVVANKLQSTIIKNVSYQDAVKDAKAGDFIYFDPPYHPLNGTSSFTAYHADGFTSEDQEELRDIFAVLDKRGCYVKLSNSSSEFIKSLYKDFRQETIYAARAINSRASKRGKIEELVVLNY